MSRLSTCVAVLLVGGVLGGCVQGRCCARTARVEVAPPQVAAPKPPVPPRRLAWYRGEDGAPATLPATLAAWQDVDLVAFGELHGDPVGAEAELAVLKAMHAQARPIALAMEFLERDTQDAVDAYLAGELTQEEFMKQARQGKAYPSTHGPLVDFCKANGIPVIAANAPRSLVSAYRKQEEDYETFRAGLSEEERGWLPEETSILEDAYQKRFLEMMGEEKGRSYFRSQSLWDDAMAEAMYDFRQERPNHRILFIVGAFHVEGGLGTISKYKLRRGKDEVRLLVMTMDKDPQLPWRAEDAGSGDLILKVPYPERPAVRGPNPHEKKPTPSPHEKPVNPQVPDA